MNKIHSSVTLEGQVQLGKNNVVLPNTVIIGPVEIGDNNIIGPNVIIGTPAQDTRTPRHDSSRALIRIGNNNIIREFTGIHKPLYTSITEIKNDIYIMQGCAINHDCIVNDKAVLASGVIIAGLVHIMEGAYLAQGVTVSQKKIIGAYSIAAMGSAVMKNIPPFSKVIPAKINQVNVYALEKYGFKEYEKEILLYLTKNSKPEEGLISKIIHSYDVLVYEMENKFIVL